MKKGRRPNSNFSQTHIYYISVCKEESYWAEAKADNVKMRVWASDQQDYETDLCAHLGLKGINITLEVKGFQIDRGSIK